MAGKRLGKFFPRGKAKAATSQDSDQSEGVAAAQDGAVCENNIHAADKPSPTEQEVVDEKSSKEQTTVSQDDPETSPPTEVIAQQQEPSTLALNSHPVTPERDLPQRRGSTRSNSNGNGTEFQSHLRKVTASLVDILDQMSNPSSTATPAGSTKGEREPTREREPTLLFF